MDPQDTLPEDLSFGQPPGLDPARAADLQARIFGQRRHIRHYVLGERIGHGAYGHVRRAFDPKLRRNVAIKEVAVGSSSTLLRLEHEAQTLAQVSHPNVVQVHESGLADEATYFIAMEFVAGPTLKAWLQTAPRSRSEILEVFSQIADGLQAVHDRGLAHGDFKPANVIVGDDGRPRIVDFGLATELDDAGARDPHRVCGDGTGPRRAHAAMSKTHAAERCDAPGWPTPSSGGGVCAARSGFFAQGSGAQTVRLHSADDSANSARFHGTPRYAAPEQFLGYGADASTDQFSWCVALFEAVFGVHPFPAKGYTALAHCIVQGDVTWPVTRGVPTWLVRLLQRGLVPDPDQRHPDMAAIVALIDRQRRGRGRAHWLSWAAVAAVGWGAASLPLGSDAAQCNDAGAEIDAVWNAARARDIEATLHASTDPALTRSIVGELAQFAAHWADANRQACRLGQPAPPQTAACLHAEREAFARIVDTVATEVADPAAGAGRSSARFGVWLSDPHACLSPSTAALRPSLRPRHRAIAADLDRVRVRRLLGRYDDALPLAQAVVEAAISAEAPELAAIATYQLGAVQMMRGAHDEAAAALANALRRAEAVGNPMLAIEVSGHLAIADVAAGRETARTQVLVDAAVARLGALGIHGTSLEGWVRAASGIVHGAAGHTTQAIDDLTVARRVLAETLESADGARAANDINLAGMLVLTPGRADDAAPLARAALDRLEALLPEEHPFLAKQRLATAKVMRRAGDTAAAQGLLIGALGSSPHDDGLVTRAMAHTELAYLQVDAGHADVAAEHLRAAALDRIDPGHVTRRATLRWCEVALQAFSAIGDHEAAADAASRALAALEAWAGATAADRAMAALRVVLTTANAGQPCQALPTLARYEESLTEHHLAAYERVVGGLEPQLQHCKEASR